MLESKKGVMVYNSQQVTSQFGYDHGAVTLTDELSTSSASVAEVRFTGHWVNRFLRVERDFSGLVQIELV